jgi:CheY-like chemotaxis protein
MNEKPTILLVDDNENDLFLMRRAFAKAAFDVPLQEVHSGVEALAYLTAAHPYSDRIQFPLPAVMLLDLNMPKGNGFDLLTQVRSKAGLRRLSVIVLTSSALTEDIERALDCGASAYLVKPSNFEALVATIRCLREWIEINHFPSLTLD